ncbi:unannotated protein [freshwater metagenome]|uniref:Unannotated protein n=1 Tax=freshwater metagenome TaxID=449393 RepID=A0A6J7PBY1_9ZZZZ
MQLLGEHLEMILGDLGEGERREVGVAELEHTWPQGEEPAIGRHVAEVLEGDEESAGGGAGHARLACHLGECLARSLAGEGADDVEAAFE